MKKVLITGGSGFLGINLARYLHKKGYQIKILDLAPFNYKDMNNKVEFIQGDVRNKKTVEKAVNGCDYVIHTAAALPLYKPKDIYSTDINGTSNMLKASLKNKIKRFVHISSTAVYGIPNHHPLKEEDKLDGVGPYGKSKVRAEKECEKYRSNGLTVSILRPKSFVGPERLGVMAIYYEWVMKGKNIPIVGQGNNKYQLLDVKDLCQAIELCLIKPKKKVNDVFNIGAEKFTTMKEDFGALLKKGKRIIGLPAKPIINLLRFLELIHLSPLYRWVYETASEDSYVSINKAKKQLGFKPKFSNKQALKRSYEWYVKHYDEFKNQSGVSHRVPWKQGILKIASWFF